MEELAAVNFLLVLLKALVFFLLGIVLWFGGTVFHGFLWWSLGLKEIPALLPLTNLAFLPFGFWLAWQLVFNLGRFARPERSRADRVPRRSDPRAPA